MFRANLVVLLLFVVFGSIANAEECEYKGVSLPAFFIKTADNGQYYFVLVADNCQVIAKSEEYTTKQKAIEGIDSIKKNAPDAEIIDKTKEITS